MKMAEKDIIGLISGGKRKRGANWTSEEEITLIEEVLKFEQQLFGKMKGAGVKGKHGKVKEETWKSITDTLNLQFKNDRTSDSIYKKYDNIKQRAKEKTDDIRRPKTGGGPPSAPLTQAEEALYQAMDTRPNIVGLVGSIDTDEPITSVQTQELAAVVEGTGDASTSSKSPGLSLSFSTNSDVRPKEKKRKMVPREILDDLEIKNSKLENEKLTQQINKLVQEQKKLALEGKKLQTEIEMLEIKKSYLLCKLSSEFPEFIINPVCQ
ncbi:uncharacterized protein LOC134258074 [Saccostrea cucullata]|uniref:uncharacterized protein LOC134258074 n=1 Tax=Saccostrea cuccullata TaxID=36930 RepID=UPI002ED5F903